MRHFEVEWGGFLPATADSIARYLADHAETLSINVSARRTHLGLKNMQTALRYVDSADPFEKHRIERTMPACLPPHQK